MTAPTPNLIKFPARAPPITPITDHILTGVSLKGVYAEYASAKLKGIDKTEALKVPGVVGVFDTNDVSCEKMIGELYIDQYVFPA